MNKEGVFALRGQGLHHGHALEAQCCVFPATNVARRIDFSAGIAGAGKFDPQEIVRKFDTVQAVFG